MLQVVAICYGPTSQEFLKEKHLPYSWAEDHLFPPEYLIHPTAWRDCLKNPNRPALRLQDSVKGGQGASLSASSPPKTHYLAPSNHSLNSLCRGAGIAQRGHGHTSYNPAWRARRPAPDNDELRRIRQVVDKVGKSDLRCYYYTIEAATT